MGSTDGKLVNSVNFFKWLFVFLIALGFLSMLLLVFFIAAKEGHFDSCKFQKAEQALKVAEREFNYNVRSKPEWRNLEFRARLISISIIDSGGNSALVLFESVEVPKVKAEMWIMDDCTQGVTLR
ncbi:hypothetical protein ACMU_17095 [Actibacterium mucosum KCTC 23349]|uniref:Uncharacterized protein n=1 Tax=Actibacterium mucosum KCTC 23349 TaxID=1454373 RepID=A0A037ZH14_9RHOB|nr:hypothetical protein [Actibacterium mucosum]KAJ54831.1 hypothetical protein ACMU_17095 [Actibacterium mucosum KCTC 23349]